MAAASAAAAVTATFSSSTSSSSSVMTACYAPRQQQMKMSGLSRVADVKMKASEKPPPLACGGGTALALNEMKFAVVARASKRSTTTTLSWGRMMMMMSSDTRSMGMGVGEQRQRRIRATIRAEGEREGNRKGDVTDGKEKRPYRIATLPGDGIGPEIMRVAVDVLRSVGDRQGIKFDISEHPVGGSAIDETGVPLPDETLAACRDSDAVLLAAIGGYKWDSIPKHIRPERGLLALRSGLGTFANLRPAAVFPQLVDASTLKREVVDGVNIMVVRELTGGLYFGEPRGFGEKEDGEKYAYNTMVYSIPEIERIAKVGFETARKRNGRLCSVDKANVLEVSQLWRQRVTEIGAEEYPDVELSHMYVDNAAMQLIRNPKQFDTIVTGNIFGDILSDITAVLGGSIGMLASASTSVDGPGLFEPIHGSAPDIAGQDKANPLAQVLSVAMMLRYGLGLESAASAVESAVWVALDRNYRTGDILAPGMTLIGCKQMGEVLLEALDVLEVRPPVPLLW